MGCFTSLKETSFAPAERKNKEKIISQAKDLRQALKDGLNQKLREKLKNNSILDLTPDSALVLNSDRQLIFANKALLHFLNLKDDKSILGLRPGEILHCAHAENDSGGCGTTKFCSACGAVKSILSTQEHRVEDQQECEIITTKNKTYNFRVWTFPFGKNTIFVLRDIADEVYRNTLEHIFFHDLTNIGSALYGWLNMINDNTEDFKKYRTLLTRLAEEISSQRDLLMSEQDSMTVNWETASNVEIIRFIVEILAEHQVAEGKEILAVKGAQAVNFKTDTRLLKRVIINMVKNALEASEEGERVLLKTTSKQDKVIFEVHNKGFIPEDVQLQMFNRSFSTKGRGRGLGIYSMKLLSENDLQSRIYFTSTPKDGTSFFIECPIEPVIEEDR